MNGTRNIWSLHASMSVFPSKVVQSISFHTLQVCFVVVPSHTFYFPLISFIPVCLSITLILQAQSGTGALCSYAAFHGCILIHIVHHHIFV
jgi:hypothetical protein